MRSVVFCGILVCALGVAALVQLVTPYSEPLVAQIQHPPPGFKLRSGDQVGIRIRVGGGDEESLTWRISVRPGTSTPVELTSGNGPVRDVLIADLAADDLVAGETYAIELTAQDGALMAVATAEIRTTNPDYSVIPLVEGNLSQVIPQIYGSDASGNLLLHAVGYPTPSSLELMLIRRDTGTRESAVVGLASTESVRVAGDGSRVFYQGIFPSPPGPPPLGDLGFGFLDLGTRQLSIIENKPTNFYSSDARGYRVAYQGLAASSSLQHFLYDEASGTRRQLTDDPQVIREQVGAGDCPQALGTRPFISADGTTVVIVTSATLGLVPPDETVGCRVFAYNVDTEHWRQVAALPRELVVDVPTLSADGRWLSFRAQSRPPQTPPLPVLLDLETGELQDPVVDVGLLGGADSVITGDGKGIVISTRADLDPRVGNADHNLELFYYGFAQRTFSQITETVGGVGSRPGGCPSYRPLVSADGGVLTFLFHRFSVESCQLDGPMRHERDGFVFSFVRAVRRRPGNRGPVFDAVPDQRVLAGETLTLELAAEDPDNDPISFFAQVKDGEDVPPGSVITDHHDGTATFTWPTRPENAGTTALRVAAFDEGGGEVVHDVNITVMASDRPTASLTPLATVSPATCAGDCDGNGHVTIDELLVSTSIALGRTPFADCSAACDSPPNVTIDCLTRAVANAIQGCP